MMSDRLKYLSEARLQQLLTAIPANLARYSIGDFSDMERENGWAVEAREVEVDSEVLARLDGSARSADADYANSLLVYRAFNGMTPALAREERVWTRLTHVECFAYTRARWLHGQEGEELVKAVRKHVFARGLPGVRDDNAVSRLWWNMHIASLVDQDDPEGALKVVLTRADTRMQFVERSGSASRRPIAKAILRAIRRDPWVNSTELSFRRFMESVNRNGGGVLFEALSDDRVDNFMDSCATRARAIVADEVQERRS